jgi:hypothetical protein
MFLFPVRAAAADRYTPRRVGTNVRGVMVAKLRLLSALCALVAAVIAVWQSSPSGPVRVDATDIPMTNVTTSIKWPVVDTVNPRPFDPCQDIPLDVIQRIGLAFTPPTPEEGLRCHFDAGNYQMAVEAFVWRTYEETLPPDALEMDINGHRAAQFWIMKPTDWNDRWWITCGIAYKTSYGVIMQTLFYSPIYGADDVDCLQTNLQRGRELSNYYKY